MIDGQVTVVVPCYNEEDRLQTEPFLEALRRWEWLHFVFVDDGSKDDTHSVLAKLCAAHERAQLVALPQNSGKAEAVRQGFLAAWSNAGAPEESRADLVGYFDADLATSLDYIEPFRQELMGSDKLMVFGSRTRLLGHHIERRGTRHYVGRVFASFAGLLLGAPVYDTQCGAKLFRSHPFVRQVFATPFTTRWCFDLEVFARLAAQLEQQGGKLDEAAVEYPLTRWVHRDGSKLSLRAAPQVALEMSKLLWSLRVDPGRRKNSRH